MRRKKKKRKTLKIIGSKKGLKKTGKFINAHPQPLILR